MSGSQRRLDTAAVVEMTRAGVNATVIAERFGVTTRTVFRHRRDAGVDGRGITAPPRPGRRGPIWTSRIWRAALLVWRDGWSVRAAARKLRIENCGVNQAWLRLRSGEVVPPAKVLTAPPRPPKPEQAYRPRSRRAA